MPSSSELNAASTPPEGDVCPPAAFLELCVCGVAEASAPVSFFAGVGEGLGATVRVRVEGLVELAFWLVLCPRAKTEHVKMIETMTSDFFGIIRLPGTTIGYWSWERSHS